jgi:hypothetical protein
MLGLKKSPTKEDRRNFSNGKAPTSAGNLIGFIFNPHAPIRMTKI